jgi:DNA polymerase-3 subunit alpha
MSFVHLRVHTQFSLLEGAIRIDDWVARTRDLGMPAAAITDTNNLFGAIEFLQAAKGAKIQPIFGSEVSYHPQGWNALLAASAKGPGGQVVFGPKFHPLILLAKNFQGYQNLSQILTQASLSQPAPQKGVVVPAKALVDRDLLDRYGDHLIVLSGCLRGEIPYLLHSGEDERARETALWFKKRFGEDFYFELLDTGLPEQDAVNEKLWNLGSELGIRCVATANCHYLDPDDAEAHEILQCIESGRNLDFDRPKSLVPSEFFLKSPEQMRSAFERFEGVCAETLLIAEKCKVVFPFTDEKGRTIYQLPNYRPEGVKREDPFDLIAYFRKLSAQGLEERFQEPLMQPKVNAPTWAELKPVYLKRLEDELGMIEKTGFSGYFLIVADFIQWAKRQGIPVGPGRGSGAGSIVAWALKITDLDPIQFKLLFERFINPERISMPDFDIDFCQDRRSEVIHYVQQKYGVENVCQIITFGKLQARAAVKDVARVLGLSFAEGDQITKLIPEELGISLPEAIEKEPRLREKMDQEPRTKKVMDYALRLEGLSRNAGIHAAGVIITEHPIVNYCPLYMGRDRDLVCQFDKDSAEKIGLVKFDFLGLKTLTVIDNAVQLIRAQAAPGSAEAEFSIAALSYDDPATFELIASGDTDGVFQVESSGMKDLCVRMVPTHIDDLTAIAALYRPGPLGSGMVDVYVECKQGRQPVHYIVPELETILSETYGVMLYQEQVMQVARELAGYSLGQADLLRRAMGKKKPEEMAAQKAIFIEGALKRGIQAASADEIFEQMAKFAEYGFNKSHSAAYGVLTYQTAYLKRHYPAEFMAALMTTEMDNTDKITKYIANSRAQGLEVLPPDVNASQKRFSVETVNGSKGIRFGLEAIKGVGGAAVDAILEARQEGKFLNVVDFCKRVSTRKANKKVIESLILAGGYDSIAEVNRASLLGSLEGLLRFAGDEQEERDLGQASLFDNFTAEEVRLVSPSTTLFKQEPDWPRSRQLIEEKKVVGFYVSGHPMDTWQKIGEDWLGWSVEKIKTFVEQKQAQKSAQPVGGAPEPAWLVGSTGMAGGGGRFRAPKTEVKLGGLISEVREVMTKKGSRMAFGQFEDLEGRIEVVFFPEAYAQCQELIRKGIAEAEPLLLVGEIEVGEESPKILAKTLTTLEDAHRDRVQQIVVQIVPEQATSEQLRALKKSFVEHRGKCPVRIEFHDARFRTRLDLPASVKLSPTPQMVESVSKIFGRNSIRLQ